MKKSYLLDLKFASYVEMVLSFLFLLLIRQVPSVNASSRGPILQLLWRAFNRHLPDISKYGIEQVISWFDLGFNSLIKFQVFQTNGLKYRGAGY